MWRLAYSQEIVKQEQIIPEAFQKEESKVNWELKYYQEQKAHLETIKRNNQLSTSNAQTIIENNQFRIQFVINPKIRKTSEKIKELKEEDKPKEKQTENDRQIP
jgi:phosphotransferase system IIB component